MCELKLASISLFAHLKEIGETVKNKLRINQEQVVNKRNCTQAFNRLRIDGSHLIAKFIAREAI